MQLEIFRGRELRQVMKKVKSTLGPDAMIIRTEVKRLASGHRVEIVAGSASEVEAFRDSLETVGGLKPTQSSSTAPRIGPYVVALVGPPGCGKTTTAVKLALNRHGFGGHTVGLLTLDTHRVGAIAELQAYAEITDLPLEVVYSQREIFDAAARLADCHAIIVDTPGRGPQSMQTTAPWHEILQKLNADEVHLVVAAGVRRDVAGHLSAAFAPLRVTHLLPTKLDEVPGDLGLPELVKTVGLPVRWVTDGQEIPTNLRPGSRRILAALGQITSEEARMAGADGFTSDQARTLAAVDRLSAEQTRVAATG